jgi:hypothetical protein
MIESLRRHGDSSDVWILCLDDDTYSYISAISDSTIHALTIEDIEAFEPRLTQVKESRSRMEYYFTCTPLLMQFVQSKAAKEHTVIYVDADLYFFQDPEKALDELGEGSIGIIEHRYPSFLAKRLAKYGTYNVGWVAFRKDANGQGCLNWYTERCLEWCYDTPEPGRYADQGYLNSFSQLHDGVVSLPDIGMNLAPWNTWKHKVTHDKVSAPLIDGITPLTFFHFHGIKPRGKWLVTSQLVYFSPMHKSLRELIYRPYLEALQINTQKVASSPLITQRGVAHRGRGLRGMIFSAQRAILDQFSIVTGNALKLNK